MPPTCGINGPYVLDSFPEVLRAVSSSEAGERTAGGGPLSSSEQIVVEMGRRPGVHPCVVGRLRGKNESRLGRLLRAAGLWLVRGRRYTLTSSSIL